MQETDSLMTSVRLDDLIICLQSTLAHMMSPHLYNWQLQDTLNSDLLSFIHVSIPPEAVGFSRLHKWQKWTFSVPGWSQILRARTPPQGAVTNPGITCMLRRVFVSILVCHYGFFSCFCRL